MIRLPLCCFLFLLTVALSAQPAAKLEADSLTRIAIGLMDEGDYTASLALLERAESIYPDSYVYTYEMGLAHYLQEQYAEAAKYYRRSLKKGCDGQCYKMLGNSYDLDGKRKKAMKTYREGIERYPDFGPLYLELGVVEATEGNLAEALSAWETGIERDPRHPSNYYHAARVYAESKEKVWALLYGETFLLLEFNTPRSEEISGLLFNLYNKVYTAQSDTSGTYDLTERGYVIYVDPEKGFDLGEDGAFHLLPFEGELAMAYSAGTAGVYGTEPLDLAGIHRARDGFLSAYFADDGTPPYRFALLERLRDVQAEGHLEAYNYLMFRMGDQVAFDFWYEEHEEEMDAFLNWFTEGGLPFGAAPHSRLGVRK